MSIRSASIRTSHGNVAYRESAGAGLPLILIHGNSFDSRVFMRQLTGEPGQRHRVIAIDLPGHGQSADADEPERSYTLGGYADAIVEVARQLGIDRAAVYGWSLGGHIAFELIGRFQGMTGLMVSGAPPIGSTPEEILAGFQPSEHMQVPFKRDLSAEERGLMAFVGYGDPANAEAHEAIARTDGRAREVVFNDMMAGAPSNEKVLAESSPMPLAIVNGADDPIVNLDYVGGLSYANLWEDHCFVLRGAGHAPFMQVPEVFDPILARFAADMEKVAVPVVRAGASGRVDAA